MNKKIATEIVIGIILIITVIIGGFIWLENRQEVRHSSMSGTNEKRVCTEEARQCSDGTFVSRTGSDCEFAACPVTTDWKTYINNHGYQIKYPIDVVVQENQDSKALIVFPNSDGNFWFFVDEKANVHSLSDVKKHIVKQASEGEGYPYKEENVKVNERDAYKLSRYDMGVIEKYYLSDNGKLLSFEFEFNFQQPNIELTESRKKLINDILSTFKPVKISKSSQNLGLSDKPEQVIREYYVSYLNYLNQNNNTDNSLNEDFVTSKIVQSHQKLVKRFPDGILANPFICAQDFPEDASKLSITPVEQTSTSAKFNVVIFINWQPISVSLIKDREEWKINEIDCGNGNKL